MLGLLMSKALLNNQSLFGRAKCDFLIRGSAVVIVIIRYPGLPAQGFLQPKQKVQ